MGSTQNFRARKCGHKTDCSNSNSSNHNVKLYTTIREYGGWDNWVMKPLEEYICKNKRQGEIREQYWIDLKKTNLNTNSAYRTKHQYYTDNKEQISNKALEYRNKNKEHLIETRKQYYINNIEQVQKTHQQYRIDNKELIVKQNSQYYIENKEQIGAKTLHYYYENKEEISIKRQSKYVCECGSEIRKTHKSRHSKSIKHQSYISFLVV